MNCYRYEVGPHPGGARCGIAPAAGVCLEHAGRTGPGALLLCPDCARRRARAAGELATVPVPRALAGARR
jgi:hypothetical protein